MPTLSGKCLCGAVTYSTDAEPMMTANCHCTDCRTATGAAYATMAFVKRDNVQISGELKSFEHAADSGSTMVKQFCPNCGSQMFTANSARDGVVGIRVGSIQQTDAVKPAFNVFCSSKIASTPLDPALPAHDKMPG